MFDHSAMRCWRLCNHFIPYLRRQFQQNVSFDVLMKVSRLMNRLCERNMSSEERQQQIESYLQKVEFAALEELAQQIGVSGSTIRRDLMTLETRGTIRRTHGGARLVN